MNIEGFPFEERFPIEPKMANRWLIKTVGVKIQDYLFSKYKLYNDGDKLMFETSCYETVSDHIIPTDLFNLYGIELEYLAPAGDIIGGFSFKIKSLNFSSSGDYANYDDLLRYHFIIEIDKTSLNPKFTNISKTE